MVTAAMADGPVIVSSNPYGDIKPYCGHIYRCEPEKWGDVLPWEFPQHASRADEEAFLRTYFTESEIHSRGGAHGDGRGFRFLKQVWYTIAQWNLYHRIPAIVDEWFQQNQEVVADPRMLEHICKNDASLQAFGFTEQQQKMHGPKLLHWVIKSIQDRVKHPAGEGEAKQPTHEQTQTGAKPVADAIDSAAPKIRPEIVRQTEGPESAVVSKAGLSVPDITPDLPSVSPGSTRMTERFPDVPWSSSEAPASATYPMGEGNYTQQPSRLRRSSNSNRRYAGSSATARFNLRQNQNQNQPYHSSTYQVPPQLHTVAPSIGEVAMHPMLNPMRFASGGPSDWMPPQHGMQPMHPMHQMQERPPPTAFGASMQLQQYGPPFQPPQQDISMNPTGFPSIPQPNPYYSSYAAIDDRSNDRYNNRSSHGHDAVTAEDASYKRGFGKRRDSEVSRGGKSRGGYASGRGRGSRGRNSFTGSRPQPDVFGADGQSRYGYRQQSSEYELAPDFYNANRNRHGSTNSQTWRSKNERPQGQQDENISSGRAVSGPSFGPQGAASGMTGLPPPPGFTEAAHRKWERNDRQTSTVQPPWPAQQAFTQNEATGAIHDERDPRATAFPGKLLTRNSIGMECGYVRKLVIFEVPEEITDHEIRNVLRAGNLEDLRRVPDIKKPGFVSVYVTLENHLAARAALGLNREETIGGVLLKIEVPKEYWDPQHFMYPGFGAPGTFPSRFGYGRQGRQPEKASGHYNHAAQAAAAQEKPKQTMNDTVPSFQDEPAFGERKPTSTPADEKMLKELLSGDTTPTASGASTPKGTSRQKKTKRKNDKTKKQQQTDVGGAALQAAFAGHPPLEVGDDHADSKSDTSTATVIQSTPHKDAKIHKGEEVSVNAEYMETAQLISETKREASVQIDDVQTKSEPTLSPELRLPQFPKVNMPQARKAMDAAEELGLKSKPLEGAPQPFRGPAETEEKTAGSRAFAKPSVAEEHVNDDDSARVAAENAGAETAKVSMSPQLSQSDAPASPQKSEDDQADDSFHTANGSPRVLSDGRNKEDRSSEESTATVTAAISTPAVSIDATAPVRNDNESNKSVDESVEMRTQELQASPKASAFSQAAKKVSVPQLPSIKVVEPVSTGNRSDGNTCDVSPSAQRSTSASGLSVPPTPVFQTAPSSPTVASSAERVHIQIGGEQQPTKKAEKVKGPAQTESLVSIYGKKPKPKKSKAAKSKASAKEQSKAARRSFSAVTDDISDAYSRAVSGTTTPAIQADERPSQDKSSTSTAADTARFDSKRQSKDDTVAAGAIPQKTTETPKADVTADTLAGADIPASLAPSQARSQSRPRGVVGVVIDLFRSTQPTQPATPEMRVDGQPSPVEASNSSAQGMHVDQQNELTSFQETHTNVAEADIEAGDRPLAPVAQMVFPSDDAGSNDHTAQPFLSLRDVHDNNGCCDSGDSGGMAADFAHTDVGLGIEAGGDDVLNPDSKPKKKKKSKSKKKKNSAIDDTTGELDESLDQIPDLEEGPSPFAFEFKANSHPTPSDDVVRLSDNTLPPISDMVHNLSDRLPPISDLASEASSQTAGRSSSREHTPTSASASASESPAGNMIAKKVARGSSHLVQAPPLRRKKGRIMSAAKSSEATTSTGDESNTVYMEAEVESTSDKGDSNALDDIMDKALHERSQNSKPPVLFMYVGPGKRAHESSWEVETNEAVEKTLVEAAQRRLSCQGKRENSKPSSTVVEDVI